MASLDEAYAEPLPMQGRVFNYQLTSKAVSGHYALLKDAYGQLPEHAGEFAPETVQAGKCISRYQEITENIKALDNRIAAYSARLDDVDKFSEEYDTMMKSFVLIRTLFFEALPVCYPKPAAPAAPTDATAATADADAESAPADAPAAPADDPHKDLNTLHAGLDAQYDSLQVCKMRFASSVIKDIRTLSEQRDALNSECSVLREFISEGLRAMKSANENIGEAANPCTICFSATVNTVVVPCGHTFCAECLKTHIGTASHSHSGKCPTCRGKVERTIKLFM